MNILIAGALDPFNNKEEKVFAEFVSDYYTEKGHTTDICYLPFKPDYHGVHEQILAYRLLTTYPAADLLITIGYPAFALKHPRKYSFLFEFLPEFHSQYNTEFGFNDLYYRIEKDQRKVANLHRTEKICLNETKGIYCASEVLKKILGDMQCIANTFSFAASLPGQMHSESNGAWLVESTVEPMDRLDIILESFSKAKNEKLIVFIPTADPAYIKAVDARVKRYNLSDQIIVIEDYINTGDLKACRGVVCMRHESGHTPSYVQWAKVMNVPCIISKDGGALHEIADGKNVFEVKPDALSVAEVLNNANTYSENNIETFSEISNQGLIDILERLVK